MCVCMYVRMHASGVGTILARGRAPQDALGAARREEKLKREAEEL